MKEARKLSTINMHGFFHFAELELGTECVVEMDSEQTILHHPNTLDKMER